MRIRIGSTIAVAAAILGLAASVAGPIYTAFDDHNSVEAGRIMIVKARR
jgi:hypothetical protein